MKLISNRPVSQFKYGRDLRIMRDHFCKPLDVANLLTKDQLKSVFLNLEELIQVNSSFSEKLQDALDIATEQGDEVSTTWSECLSGAGLTFLFLSSKRTTRRWTLASSSWSPVIC